MYLFTVIVFFLLSFIIRPKKRSPWFILVIAFILPPALWLYTSYARWTAKTIAFLITFTLLLSFVFAADLSDSKATKLLQVILWFSLPVYQLLINFKPKHQ